MKNSIITFCLFLFIFSCSSDEGASDNDSDYLIFGHFYGFCIGEACIETFKLTEDKLFEDTEDNYANPPFNFELLTNDKFEAVKDITDFFPTELLSETEDTFGCPDCADGGGVFIEYSKNGVVKNWRIDQMKAGIPEYLHPFIDKVNEKIGLINN